MRSRLLLISGFMAMSAFPLAKTCQAQMEIPKASDGYEVTKTDNSQNAPEGFTGRTEDFSETLVGNTPKTLGKKVVTHFVLSNKIKTCPEADGTTQGDGLLTATVDLTSAQADGTTTGHIEMRITAKYKGKVGDDALIDNPVYADMDYIFSSTGRTRNANGTLTTPVPTNAQQHISVPIVIGKSKGMDVPTLGQFSGGDPTQGHLGDAYGAGMALAFFGGIYYSIAQAEWTEANKCAQVDFDPPSNTVQLVLGGTTDVKVQVKSKAGAVSKGVEDAQPNTRKDGVTPPSGTSDLGSPMTITYTAPNEKTKDAGFALSAVSRAGVAQALWKVGFGTDWSGQLSCSSVIAGDEGQNELQTWVHTQNIQMTINVLNREGTAIGSTEEKHMNRMRQHALRNQVMTIIETGSVDGYGYAQGSAKSTIEVNINKATGTYTIQPGYAAGMPEGRDHTTSCDRGRCNESDLPFYVQSCFSGMTGKLSDANHLQGSRTEVKPGVGYIHNGTLTTTVTWDLARQGTTK